MTDLFNDYGTGQCLKWSKKEARSLPQSEVNIELSDFLPALGKSKSAGSLTRPHFKPWYWHTQGHKISLLLSNNKI